MPATLAREKGNVFRLNVSGLVRAAELQQAADTLAGEIGDAGRARLLVVLDGFHGWGPDNWAAFKFYAEHGDRIERIAIVADQQWWERVKMFVAAGLRRAPVQCFVRGAMSLAREWIAEGSEPPGADRMGSHGRT
jgi:hypothetical protein